MPFTFSRPRQLDISEISPYSGIFPQAIQSFQNAIKSAYLKPSLEEELQKAKLFNKYYGPNIESEMAVRQAELSKLPLQKALLVAQIGSAKSLSSKRQLIQDLLRQSMTASPFQQAQEERINPQSSMNDFQSMQGLGVLRNPFLIQSNLQQQEPQIAREQKQLSFPQAELLTKEIFGTQPHFIEVNGQHLAVTPFGNIPIAKGLTEQEKAAQQAFGKYSGKLYEESTEALKGYQNQNVALDELTNAIETNPEFRNVTGPIKGPLTQWLGTPEQKELYGRLASSSGEIALQVAPALKGAFTGRDQTLINSIKASPRDFPDVFIGKLKAQKLINNVLAKRSEIMAELIEKGASPISALKTATKKTSLDKFRPIVEKLTEHRRRNAFVSKALSEPDETKGYTDEQLFAIMEGGR